MDSSGMVVVKEEILSSKVMGDIFIYNEFGEILRILEDRGRSSYERNMILAEYRMHKRQQKMTTIGLGRPNADAYMPEHPTDPMIPRCDSPAMIEPTKIPKKDPQKTGPAAL